MTDTRTFILDTAEGLLRKGGYSNCSFRDIAAEVGIKSASVHHHFPTKQALALAVTQRYGQRFMSALGEPIVIGQTPQQQIVRYGDTFHLAYKKTRCACLCGILCGEVGLLPEELQQELTSFITANISWLETALAGPKKKPSSKEHQLALHIYSSLQGAMHVTALYQSDDWIKTVAQSVSGLAADF